MRSADFQSVAVGFFDGVHLGHQSILKGAAAALTFRNHPLTVLSPERAPRLLMDAEERLAAIRACGVGEVVALDFTPEFARLSPEEFLEMAGITRTVKVRCGANWRFGRGGTGDADWLMAHGYSVDVVLAVKYRGEIVSSTRIRAALERGEVEDACAMLGRPFEVRGEVFSGKGEGSCLGYPTMNLKPRSLKVRLPLGVYVAEVGGARAVANYGFAPTFGERAWEEPVVEVHFLRQTPDVRDGFPAEVKLLRFLRPERKFDSPDALKSQIARDCAAAVSLQYASAVENA